MPETEFVYPQFAFSAMAVSTGCYIAAVLCMKRWHSVPVCAAVGAFESVLYASSQQVPPVRWEWVEWALGGGLEGVGAAILITLLFRFRKSRERPFLLPRLWPEAIGRATASPKDLARRFVIAVAAGTGSIVGTLMTLRTFWGAVVEALSPPGLLLTLVLTLVYVTVIGPLHEYAVDGLRDRGPQKHSDSGEDSALTALWEGVTWRSVGRFALVWLLLVSLHLCYVSLEQCARNKQLQSIYVIFVAGTVPAIASYYWSAASQLNVSSIRMRASYPIIFLSIMMGASMWVGGMVDFFDPDGFFWAGIRSPWFSLAKVAMVLFYYQFVGFLVAAPSTLAGGWALDRFRGNRVTLALSASIVVAASLSAVLSTFIVTVAVNKPLNQIAFSSPVEAAIASSIGWLVGLWASGFLNLIRQRTTAAPRFVPVG
jgi:hypothetical protein